MATKGFFEGIRLQREREAKKELERARQREKKREIKNKVANSLLERSIKDANPEGISQAIELLGLTPQTAQTLFMEAATSKRIRDEKAGKEKQLAQILTSMQPSDPERARIAAIGQRGFDRGFSTFPRPPGVAPAIGGPPTIQQTTPPTPGAMRPPMSLSPQGEQLGQGIDVEPRWMTAGLPREPDFRYGHEGMGGAGLEGRMAQVVREADRRQMTPQVGRGIDVEPPIEDFPTLDPKTFMSPLERQQFENPFSEDPSGAALTDTAAAPFLPELPLPKSPIQILLDEREKRLEKEKKTKGDGDDKRPLTQTEIEDEAIVNRNIAVIEDVIAGRVSLGGQVPVQNIIRDTTELVATFSRSRQKIWLKLLRDAQKVELKEIKGTAVNVLTKVNGQSRVVRGIERTDGTVVRADGKTLVGPLVGRVDAPLSDVRDTVLKRKLAFAEISTRNFISAARRAIKFMRDPKLVLGGAGALIRSFSGVTQQAKQLFDAFRGQHKGTQESILNPKNYDFSVLRGIARANTKTKAQFISIAYMLARSREPGGRLAKDDVKLALDSLGLQSNDKDIIAETLRDRIIEIGQGFANYSQVITKQKFNFRKSFDIGPAAGGGGGKPGSSIDNPIRVTTRKEADGLPDGTFVQLPDDSVVKKGN